MSGILAIAHRGARAYAPENTLAGFTAAMHYGADGVELDVHLSADGKLIVIHDPTIDRTTNGSGEVRKMSLQQLRAFHVAGLHPIPTLAEVLDAVGPSCLINIEIKTIECAMPTVQLLTHYIEHRAFQPSAFIISSFDWAALQLVRETDHRFPIGVLTATDMDLAIAFATFINAETIHPYYHLITCDSLNAIHKQNMRVFAWTVNEYEDIATIRNLKPHGIITDYPERI